MKKKYWDMTTEELAAATKQFNEPLVADQSRPLTPAEQKQWQQIQRKRGRPLVGKGHRRISVSMESGLLAQVNALAKKRGISRSQLFAQAVEATLAEEASGKRP